MAVDFGKAAGRAALSLGAVALGAAAGAAAERLVMRFSATPDGDVDLAEFYSLHGEPFEVFTSDGAVLAGEVDRLPESQVTIVMPHGFALNRNSWYYQRLALRDRATLVFYDQRGHGESTYVSDAEQRDHSLDQLGRDLFSVINQVAPEDTLILIGHSMGGKAAMTLALRDPDLVRSLMVIDIAPVVYDHEYQPYIDAMRHVPVAELGRRSEAESYMESLIPDPSIRSFLLQNLGQDERGLNWQVNLDAIENGISEILGFPDANGDPYEGPTKFLRGGKSDFVLDQHLPRIESLFPMATLDTVSGAGHWVHAEKPEDVISAIRTFTADAA